jgi:hypothetical protein
MRALFSILLCAQALCLPAQHRFDYQWPFGYGSDIGAGYGISALSFSGGAVAVSPYGEAAGFELRRSAAFLCDEDGELMLMTNNCRVVDKHLATIDGGDTITPGATHDLYCPYGYYPGGHCVLLLPEMGDDSTVYLVHKNSVLSTPLQAVIGTRLYLSTIVRRADGTFYVKEKQRLLLSVNQVGGQLTAVLNAESDRWWIWSIEYGTNRFHKFLIGGPEGAAGPFVQEIGPALFIEDTDVGQAAFSPDGRWLGINIRTMGALLYGFDAATGELSAPAALPYPEPGAARGLAFSPNSRFVYVTTLDHLYQIDLEASGASDQVAHLGYMRGEDLDGWPVAAGMMHLGPDCRVYISPSSTSRFLHVIHQPDLPGPAAQAEKMAIYTPTRVTFHLPNIPMFRFGGSCDSTIAWGIPAEAAEPLPPAEGARLFPNPASDWAYLELPAGHAWAWAAAYDARGQEVRRIRLAPGQREAEIATAGWPPGLYFVRLGPQGGGPALRLVVAGR